MILLFLSIAGCGEQDKPAKASDPVALKVQLEALGKVKSIERPS